MSHIVEIKTEVRDAVAARAACERMKLEPPTEGTARLFSGEVTGLIVKLPGWKYPAVFDTQTGQAKFDTFGGRWGDQAQLEKFLQQYAVEKTKIESRKAGHTCTEQQLADGSVKLSINVGGSA